MTPSRVIPGSESNDVPRERHFIDGAAPVLSDGQIKDLGLMTKRLAGSAQNTAMK